MKKTLKSNDFLIVGAIAISASLAGVGCTSQSTDEKKPNVIFIYADDMGRGMLSYYGQQHLTTPNIDRVFRQGTCFENAHGSYVSAPSRASMLTGYSDARNGRWKISGSGQYIRKDIEMSLSKIETKIDRQDVRLPEDDITLPQLFKRAGYVTGEVGKLEWGFTATREQMRRHEWDYYYGYLDHTRCHGFYPPFLFENGEMVKIEGNTRINCGKNSEVETPENYAKRWNMEGKEVYSQDLFLEKILNFIRDNKDRPFFLYHPTQLPHGPVSAKAVHPELKDDKELCELEKEYGSMVKMLDDHVGVILAELEKLDILDNTIIVFSADNGHETYYEVDGRNSKRFDIDGRTINDWDYAFTSDRVGDRFDGNDGKTGKKRTNYEGGISVPLAFMWNDHIETNKVSQQLTANYDILTTFADLLNVELPYKKDGVSLLPILTEGEDMLSEERYIAVSSLAGKTILCSDGWKYRHHDKRKAAQLFYLPSDYKEEHNLIDEQPEIAERLKTELTKYTGKRY